MLTFDAAKQHGLKMWVFDEKWRPSGELGGQVPPQYGSKKMVATATNVAGPIRFTASGFGQPNLIAAGGLPMNGRHTRQPEQPATSR